MCIHDKADLKRVVRSSPHALRPDAPYTVLWWEGPKGEVYGVDCINPASDKEIANVVRNLREWHPHIKKGTWTIHLEHVNLQRWLQDLPPVTLENLPPPEGAVPASADTAVLSG